ncbi:hypothetical protein EDB85DRAFT_2157284 [Lactarius pseudohatsudake]|nr:hypothetical protein EDB85DRAFT_2157284 [Lactarius pseudohatsudake]
MSSSSNMQSPLRGLTMKEMEDTLRPATFTPAQKRSRATMEDAIFLLPTEQQSIFEERARTKRQRLDANMNPSSHISPPSHTTPHPFFETTCPPPALFDENTQSRLDDEILAGRGPLPYPVPRQERLLRDGLGNNAVDWLLPRHDMQRCDVYRMKEDGGTARYILRGQREAGLDGHVRLHPTSLHRADVQPTHVSGFGRNMGDSPMVIVWPPRGADGEYNSVALSQRKAPYEVMPTPDPHPPFTAKLSITDPYVTVENPQIAFTRNAPPDGMQNIIWAFSRTPPGSDPGAPISIHHKIGRGMLDLTRIPDIPAKPPAPLPPPKEDHHDDEKAKDEGESHDDDDDDDAVSGGSTAGFVHGALCDGKSQSVPAAPPATIWRRFVPIPPPPVVLHSTARHSAGASIAGGTLAYLFMDNHGSSMAHKVGGIGLVLLYVAQCAFGSWVHRIPKESRTGARGALLAGLGGAIVLLAFFETWLGLISAGRSTLVWSALLLTVPALYVVGVMTVQRRFRSVRTRRESLLTTDDAEAFAAAAAVDVCLLSGSADDESLAFLPPDRTASTTGARNTGDDVESAFALLQKELAARCGGTRSTSLARWGRTRGAARRGGDGGHELEGGEAGAGARSPREDTRNDVSERYRASSSSAIAFLIMLFVIRFT